MNPLGSLTAQQVIVTGAFSSSTAKEGYVDTLGASEVIITAGKSATSSSSLDIDVRYSTASNTAYSSATAFSTAITATTGVTNTADVLVVRIDLSKVQHDRYLIVKATPNATTPSGFVLAHTNSKTSPTTEFSATKATVNSPAQP